MDLCHQEPQIVFGGPEAAQKLMDVLDGQKKNYEEDVKTALDLKKYGNYHNLTQMYITPEFTLPGGRCLACDNSVFYQIKRVFDNKNCGEIQNVYTNSASQNNNCLYQAPVAIYSASGTVADVYTLFENGYDIEVLSDNNGRLSFEPVSMIWKSGKKPLIRIETISGDAIEVSKDHIMFVDGVEVPASEVKKGDPLHVLSSNSIITSKVFSICEIKPKDTFDIEVPSTANLFVENIKCHNSRWFRYLFSSGTG